MHTASVAGAGTVTITTQGGSNEPAVVSATKIAEDALISWRRGRRDSTRYPIWENDKRIY